MSCSKKASVTAIVPGGAIVAAALLIAVAGCRCESGPPRGTLGTITLSAAPAPMTTDGGDAAHVTDGGDAAHATDGSAATLDGGPLR